MKKRLQLTLPLVLAVLFAVLWFSFWLTSFRPARAIYVPETQTTRVVLWDKSSEALIELQSQSLFADPSDKGFSGTFPKNKIQTPLKLSSPSLPDFYLSRKASSSPTKPLQDLGEIELPTEKLNIPNAAPRDKPISKEGITLFFSNNLKERILAPMDLDILGDIPDSLRASISVNPKGTVSKLFFASPVENPALAGALRQLRFRPAPRATNGWLELRNIPKGEAE